MSKPSTPGTAIKKTVGPFRVFLSIATGAIILIGLFEANGRATTERLDIGTAHINVTFVDNNVALSRTELMEWIRQAASAVTAYYGRFPIATLSLRVSSFDGRGVDNGTTWPQKDGSGLIKISVGRYATCDELARDWTLTHEMVHLAFPSMAEDHHWIEEGLATYVEPWARVRVGALSSEKAWADVVRDMPKGQPEWGDHGLDNTHTWGRTYWGGALFCLLADVAIRKKTANKKGLQDALQAILDAGGTIATEWDINETLAIGDKGTGTNVLTKLYSQMSNTPMDVDLPTLWKQLGVTVRGSSVVFEDTAPLAMVRRGIETGNGKIHTMAHQ